MMRNRSAILGLLLLATAAQAQDTGGSRDATAASTATTGAASQTASGPVSAAEKAAMDVWMKYASPGDKHQMFKRLDGNWTAAGKFWMGASAPPTTATFKTENHVLMDGRYMTEK